MHYAGASDVATFIVAAFALAGLAWIVAFATEALGERFGPGMTGVLQSTLGNLPEFFVVLFAINAGELLVAQTSLIGSLLANGLLAVAGVGAAFVSDWFISALGPAIDSLGISRAFAGLVIVAIAGNAVENTTALILARKGQNDLAISVVKNSVSQIAVFLFPALILVSLLLAHTLTFVLPPVYIASLALSAVAIWQITGDGEARAYEGAALVALFVIVGAVAWFD